MTAAVKEIQTTGRRSPSHGHLSGAAPPQLFPVPPGAGLIFWGSSSQGMPGEVLVSEYGASHNLDTPQVTISSTVSSQLAVPGEGRKAC